MSAEPKEPTPPRVRVKQCIISAYPKGATAIEVSKDTGVGNGSVRSYIGALVRAGEIEMIDGRYHAMRGGKKATPGDIAAVGSGAVALEDIAKQFSAKLAKTDTEQPSISIFDETIIKFKGSPDLADIFNAVIENTSAHDTFILRGPGCDWTVTRNT